jgi:hypothetical protein
MRTLLIAALGLTTACAADATQFDIVSVEPAGAAFRQAITEAVPEVARHLVLPKEKPDPTKLQSWMVCPLKPAELAALLAKLPQPATKELPAQEPLVRVESVEAALTTLDVHLQCRYPDGQKLTTTLGVLPNQAFCFALPDAERPDGFRIYIVSPQ